ncbi:PD-(D/E)XK nuclease family protein [Rhizobium ruizarguesonis]|uniref:PD-(D/E)XK nuclease family protein n=1 Tax=Rhizobium ruizarguesonis TaxID=2081791 RepID=UPI001035934A|nr:PD-(D/E)XK nuclease family protein [Rhizobium ruizarguesonis]NEI81395.1 PD-(D/E)XK nuclease family protein [Rhizobium ruizarguesonis]NEK06921.1 PD-(D/E)XK nuclease family protein [Rhizobium ruizarguesonis]TBD39630.1 PD-(D/E)XK nuclease family protein [Rhizobium ruizarguesonis]
MFYPFEVADPTSGLHYRLNDSRLAELSLAPLPKEWNVAQAIAATPDPVWAESLSNAPTETIAAVSFALSDLIVATRTLRPTSVDGLPENRSARTILALRNLWIELEEALPDGLEVARHVMELPHGQFLDPLPVVAGTLDPLAPAAMTALYERLDQEFGSVPAPEKARRSPDGSRLWAIQGGLKQAGIPQGSKDGSLSFYGLRDVAACAEFAAAKARRLIEAGCPARQIAVLASSAHGHIARAFAAQGVPLSGLPAKPAERDLAGETLLLLLLAKRTPTPAMALASLCISPLMPWEPQVGRDLAEELMGGDFRARALSENEMHKQLWEDTRKSASSRSQLRFLLDRICNALVGGTELRARLQSLQAILAGEGNPDWEAILRAVQIHSPAASDPDRNLEGVTLWAEGESPWRPCSHLVIVDFVEGLYPSRPRANPLFLDSEISSIAATTRLQLRGRAENLARSLAVFDEQLQAVGETITFLIPRRDFAGGRIAPSAGLSLISRAFTGINDGAELVSDLSRMEPRDWPVAHHILATLPDRGQPPESMIFRDRDLLSIRMNDDGMALPQSPSRLETLIVSPLAWLLDEIGAGDMSWSAETLDVIAKGNIAHDVFEHVFLANTDIPDEQVLIEMVSIAFDKALSRHAGFIRTPSWEMERTGLERDIREAAIRWRSFLVNVGARILGNEVRLRGQAHGLQLAGRADCILELENGSLVIVDHKKSSTSGRRRRMEKGWDLQAGLYRDMLAKPLRREADGLDLLIGRTVGVAYHLMNDGGFLTSGVDIAMALPAREMGTEVEHQAVTRLTERLTELAAGEIRLNTKQDEAFFKKDAGFTPYALDRSPLIGAFMWEIEE